MIALRISCLFGASLALSFALAGCCPAESNRSNDSVGVSKRAAKVDDRSNELFEQPPIRHLSIELAPADRAKLATNPREWVRCRLKEEGEDVWHEVAIKLKGAAGSFQEIDGKPAFTLKMDKYLKQQTFHGLSKFHLNNSVQSETYLDEWLCADLFQQAKVPAARIAHAVVLLDGRMLGMYVLKEGFDRKFIARYFADDGGNLYDGGFCTDIDTDLERDVGKGDDNHADQHALHDACRAPDLEERWRLMAERLDVEAFLTFAAMELMTCHWDGYCQNQNNYRLYFDAASGKAHFFPHGMDQMFGDPGAPILNPLGTIVASAVMENPAWRARFRDRIHELLPLFNPPDRLLKRIDSIVPRLHAELAKVDAEQAAGYEQRIAELKERITARAENLQVQSEMPDPPPPSPIQFEGTEGVEIAEWEPASETEGIEFDVVDLPEERHAYQIRSEGEERVVGSWRKRVLLSRGNYRLVARAAISNVAALHDDKGMGAGIRISGSSRSTGLEGTGDWQKLEFRFSVDEVEQEVTLVAELRATAGQVQFDVQGMRLFREE